jgi:endonuclease/exonuclease/phosphatase family metal-dependent hydrolase
MPDGGRLTVASYNVHCCVGTDGRYDVERIAHVIRELASDVVALQEVESPYGEHGESDQLSHLARSAGFPRAVAAPTLTRGRGPFGNALLSRFPVQSVRRVDLSVIGREPRGALDVELDCDGIGVRVIASHFGLRSVERAFQWRRVFSVLEADCSPITIVLGDFNHWWWRDRALHGIEDRLGKTPAPRTFPSRRPIFALDRVWVQPRAALRSVHSVRTALTRVASDHLPLRAELDLAARASP